MIKHIIISGMAKSLNEVSDRLREQQRERHLRGEHCSPDQSAR